MRITEDEERDAFFAEIGHDEELHRPLQLSDDVAPGASAAFMRHSVAVREGFGSATSAPDRCGWWWCPRRGATPRWADLREAVRRLREDGVDPQALEVAQLAELSGRVDLWAAEYDGYADLRQRLQEPADGDAERLRLKWLEELQPLLTNATAFAGHAERKTRPRNEALRQAIAFGQQRGWSPKVVASALLLVGADRSDLASLKKKVGEMVTRSGLRIV